MSKNIKEWIVEQLSLQLSYREGWESYFTKVDVSKKDGYVNLQISPEDIAEMRFEEHPWIKLMQKKGLIIKDCDLCDDGLMLAQPDGKCDGFICAQCMTVVCGECEYRCSAHLSGHDKPMHYLCGYICGDAYDRNHI